MPSPRDPRQESVPEAGGGSSLSRLKISPLEPSGLAGGETVAETGEVGLTAGLGDGNELRSFALSTSRRVRSI
ncbi:MAG: hypothetical protein IID18_04245, partial [Nitrospinae bacterium]|nr:hypothetical protein [Nitrospinota bacterium]